MAAGLVNLDRLPPVFLAPPGRLLMPIRFNCQHCGQKLSVGSQRAGTKANCPRCKEIVRVPGDPPKEKPVSKATLAASMLVMSGEGTAVETAESKPAPEQVELGGSFAAEYPAQVESSELVFDTTPSTGPAENVIQQIDYDLVSFPRYVLYAQAGLLATVAIICFTLGALMGGAFLSTQSSAAAGPVTVTGTVKVSEGVTTKADEGAVVFFLPHDTKNITERAPVAGLRPRDSAPEGNHRGLFILKDMGAGYARTDKEGRYKITVPKRGKYFMLVISRGKVGNGADIGASKQKIARFFENANDLLTTQKYQFSVETLADGRRFDVSFE
jgi:phage FluMu protein Com